ncbi:MAG TPA: acetolactate synthase [Clostridiales bacterium]|nr:acetolactate synthase [Clostridiales bacterium]
MKIKQLSIFIENRTGRLAEITQILASRQVDIRALSLADTSDFGILRLIVNNPDVACAALLEAGVMVRTTEVLAVSMVDEPGGFSRTVAILSQAGVGIEYLYAFVSRKGGEAVVILRPDDSDKAVEVLQRNGVRLLQPEEVYHL